MKYLHLKNGDKMPALGLGTWKSAPGEVYKAIREAISIGYRHIDCAAIYQNEVEIGNAFRDAFSEGDVKREELWITSKLWNDSHHPQNVVPALKKTLSDLQLDYLDLYLIHWPIAFQPQTIFPQDPSGYVSLEEVPLTVTWKAMQQCANEGLSRHIGVSNFSVKKLQDLVTTATIKPEVNQIELHPFLAQQDMLTYCLENDIVITAYAPLGSKGRDLDENEPDLLTNETITKIAQQQSCTPAQVLLSWAVSRGTATIPKSTNPKRLRENFQSVTITLSEENIKEIDALDRHYRFFHGKFWGFEGTSYSISGLWDE